MCRVGRTVETLYFWEATSRARELAPVINLFYFYRVVLKFRSWNSERDAERRAGDRRNGGEGRDGRTNEHGKSASTVGREGEGERGGRAHAGIKNIYVHYVPSLPSLVRSCGFDGAAHTYGTNLVKLFRNREIPAVPTYRSSKRRKRVSLSKDLRDFEKRGKRKRVPNGSACKMGY